MTVIFDLFDAALFAEMRDQRYINVQTHPKYPLAIANYSSSAQFDRVWNDATMNCRGLIYNSDTMEIVARGYRKFFNWDDSSQPFPPTGPCLRAPKMDGSLGILYGYNGNWAIATRGSFTSDQALKATSMLAPGWELELLTKRGRSYLFEIIYPENRIVVNYGLDERLVFLDALDTATGKADLEEFDAWWWPDKAEKINMPGFRDTMASDIPQGEEGFVFYWPEKDFRTKMKAAEYLELHRMIFGMNARTVWERLGNGDSIADIATQLPDEFHKWVNDIAFDLFTKASEILVECHREYARITEQLDETSTRRDFAELAVHSRQKSFLFLLKDGKDIWPEIWKTVKPSGTNGITAHSEDVA